jgi:hypothetical protein
MAILQVKTIDEIPQYIFPPFFRRQHLKQKPVIGFLGNPGEGKSFSMAVTLFMEGLCALEPVWGNMSIKATVCISDKVARWFHLSKGGEVLFEAKTVDKMKLLRMDKEYHHGWHGLDEVNAEYAEAMRSSSNVNLYFDRMEQQHRKDQMGMVYSAIHEMWVDNRLRKLTDAFVRVEDVALSPEGLNHRMPQGEVFKWTVYPHSRLICGWTHEQTGMTLGPYYLHTKQFQGIFDTLQKQAEGQTKYAVDLRKGVESNLEVKESPQTIQEHTQWGWLYDKLLELHNMNIPEVVDDVLWDYLELDKRKITPHMIGRQLASMGVQKRPSAGHYLYIVDNFDLERIGRHARETSRRQNILAGRAF